MARKLTKRRARIVRWALHLAKDMATEAPNLGYIRAIEAFAPHGNPSYTARVLRECIWRAYHGRAV